MALTPYVFGDPIFSNIDRAMDRAFERAFGPLLGGVTTDRPGTALTPSFPGFVGPALGGAHPMDIVETKDAYELTCDAPGMDVGDINVELSEGVVTISGQKQREAERTDEQGKVVRRERAFSRFTRSFTLPDNVKEQDICASLNRGVLTVVVPKAQPAARPAPKRIAVEPVGQ